MSAEKERGNILTTVVMKTQIRQTQLILGIITDEGKAELIEWMLYAQKIQAVDPSTVPDIQWPKTPE
ncbi:tail fiber assembly protein [Photorhabdus khanii]|uniref:Phage tail protein n=1 Tax=Photorhabdus khanii subsp. guanajuatensis TaxID=2100166 RepID=A0A4R4K582_9GAMM|nr:tail fiber assembly protein [Photorhabdus khanii]TDB61666.1 phage tail protein [Photorhabdus khanii subsp. guanajuatensis]